MQEIWKDIPGWEEFYQISTLGRVKSIDHIVDRMGVKNWPVKGRVLKGGKTYKGYKTVMLCGNGVQKAYYVHRLVLETFVGP